MKIQNRTNQGNYHRINSLLKLMVNSEISKKSGAPACEKIVTAAFFWTVFRYLRP